MTIYFIDIGKIEIPTISCICTFTPNRAIEYNDMVAINPEDRN